MPKFDINNEPNIFGSYRFSRQSRHNNQSRLNNENLEVIYDLPQASMSNFKSTYGSFERKDKDEKLRMLLNK